MMQFPILTSWTSITFGFAGRYMAHRLNTMRSLMNHWDPNGIVKEMMVNSLTMIADSKATPENPKGPMKRGCSGRLGLARLL
jgi:hypothetical protein